MKTSFKINIKLLSKIVRKKKSFVSKLKNKIGNINTTDISDSKSLERVV